MKKIAILGFVLPFCLAIRVKEFVYKSDDAPKSHESEEQIFAEVVHGNSDDLSILKAWLGAYSVPKEELLVSKGVGDDGITAELNEFADKLIGNFDGWLQDLATIARLNNVIASYKSQTRTLKIALPLQFDSLAFSYKYDRHAVFHHKGTVQGKIEKVKIDCQLSYNYATYKVKLDKFDIRDSGFFLHPIVLDVIQLIVKNPIQHMVDGVNDAISKIFKP
nr:unnamed protein product [Callosobruchus analis]